MSQGSGDSSGSDSESEVGMALKRVRALQMVQGCRGLSKYRYTALEILTIQQEFTCKGSQDCPMLNLVEAAPEILRCRTNPPANKTGRPKQPLPYLNAKAKSPSAGPAILLRSSGQRLSLNQRFTFLRNGQAPPTSVSNPDSADNPSSRLVAFVDADWL